MKLKFPPGLTQFIDSHGNSFVRTASDEVVVESRREHTITEMKAVGFLEVIEAVVEAAHESVSAVPKDEKPVKVEKDGSPLRTHQPSEEKHPS